MATSSPTAVIGYFTTSRFGKLVVFVKSHFITTNGERLPDSESAGDLSTGPARSHVPLRRIQWRLRADQSARRRVHDAAHRRDWLDHRDAERHLRQPHSAHTAAAPLEAAGQQ